jgi:hypothetical protein
VYRRRGVAIFVKIGTEKGVVQLCPYFDFLFDTVKIRFRRSSVEATQEL